MDTFKANYKLHAFQFTATLRLKKTKGVSLTVSQNICQSKVSNKFLPPYYKNPTHNLYMCYNKHGKLCSDLKKTM